MTDEKSSELQDREIKIEGPDCMPMVISIKNNKDGVAIAIRIGKGSENLSAFGVKPRGTGGIQALDGGDPGNPPTCP